MGPRIRFIIFYNLTTENVIIHCKENCTYGGIQEKYRVFPLSKSLFFILIELYIIGS